MNGGEGNELVKFKTKKSLKKLILNRSCLLKQTKNNV